MSTWFAGLFAVFSILACVYDVWSRRRKRRRRTTPLEPFGIDWRTRVREAHGEVPYANGLTFQGIVEIIEEQVRSDTLNTLYTLVYRQTGGYMITTGNHLPDGKYPMPWVLWTNDAVWNALRLQHYEGLRGAGEEMLRVHMRAIEEHQQRLAQVEPRWPV